MNRTTALVQNETGYSLLLVIVFIALLTIIGGIAMRRAAMDVKISGNYLRSTKVLYIAEAGIERAKAELAEESADSALAGPDKKTGSAFEADNGILSFGSHVAFGGGEYSVTVSDNNDGDGNPWVDTDGKIIVRSTGTLSDGSRRTIEVVIQKTSPATASFKAAIMCRGPVEINGNISVDGRDHDINGNLLSPANGVLAFSSRNTFNRSGNGKVAGTSLDGTNYALSKSSSVVSAVTQQFATAWGNPMTPEEVLGMTTTNALKTIAQGGANGSQYVTNPSNLHFPLSGVTYVELGSGQTWQSMDFGSSSGILIVHNSATNAVLKNTNGGTFKGIIIADDYVHIHNTIIGAVITLTANASEGNVIGNGNGSVSYSSLAIASALSSLPSGTNVISWQELF
jgi:Tfp pilus assembly protein PilX